MNRTAVARELLAVAKDLLAMDFPTQDAMDKYLKEHPDADRSNHRVVKTKKDSKNHPANADMKTMFEIGQTKGGFEKALKEHAKSNSPEDVKSAAKDFHDAAEQRKKEVAEHIIKFLKKNNVKDMNTKALWDVAMDKNRSSEVQRRAENLYTTYASMGNIMDMAKEKMG